MPKHIVIVGAGQAGVATAFKLRSHGHDGPITLVGEEAALPYHRPPLSKKFITERLDVTRLHIKPIDLYRKENITLINDCQVRSINREAKCLTTSDGRSIAYDRLVLAVGAQARRLPDAHGGSASNVLTLRTVEDAMRLRDAFVQQGQLLVIGGGYIGLETAAVARSLGMTVTIIEQGPRILGRVASAETAAYFRNLHREQGVSVREGVSVARFAYDGDRITAAVLSDGVHVEVDIVIAGIGVNPNTDLAAHAGLTTDNGIVVDRSCRTSDPAIYALGDCASFPYQGGAIRLESVQNAVDMADVVARSITEKEVEYTAIPWFWSDQYGTKLQIAGLNMGYTRVAVRQSHPGSLSVWYFAGERLIAVDAINDPRAFMMAKRLIGTDRTPAWEAIQNPSIELSALSVA